LEAVIQYEPILARCALAATHRRSSFKKHKVCTGTVQLQCTRKTSKPASNNGNHAASLINRLQKQTRFTRCRAAGVMA
jgi:hypothetical protein